MVEAITVLVATPSEMVARVAAPELARRQHPDRLFDDQVVHVEWLGSRGAWEVAVRDLGPRKIATTLTRP